MITYSQVYKIRQITDNAEVIVDISISLIDDDGRLHHHDIGYGIIFLKDGECISQISVPWMPVDELKKCHQKIQKDMAELCNHIRKKRDYE